MGLALALSDQQSLDCSQGRCLESGLGIVPGPVWANLGLCVLKADTPLSLQSKHVNCIYQKATLVLENL